MSRLTQVALHAVLIAFAGATLLPFVFVLNNSFRTNAETFHTFFGLPQALEKATQLAVPAVTDPARPAPVENADGVVVQGTVREAFLSQLDIASRGYRFAWESIRPYMLNTFVVCGLTVAGVLLLGSLTAYVLSRYRFPGSRGVFYYIISTMMFPGVLTLVPSFMLVRELGLLNSYWSMVLPYVAGGQVFAIFVFKSFFDGLPEELFESARLDGAGHFQCYRHIVIPLSKPILSVVAVMTTLGTWNNFLWPFITNTEGKYHVIASGLYVLAMSQFGQNYSTLFAAYMISSVPLLLLFVYATKPFIQGVTSGAFKA
jgi:ABC-type glycerol-3-phosphate transport system permease component